MKSTLLCVLHNASDEQGFEGFLSIYYDNSEPILSFVRYASPKMNFQLFPFKKISSIYVNEDNETILNIFIDNCTVPSAFRLSSIFDMMTLLQVAVANGLLCSDKNNNNVWVQANGLKPTDPIEWIFMNSTLNDNLSIFHHNSHDPYAASLEFPIDMHEAKIKKIICEGKKSKFYRLLTDDNFIHQNIRLLFDKNDDNENIVCTQNQIDEYLSLRRQWESHISQQNNTPSKHNSAVEKISKDLLRSISNNNTLNLLYNVLRTLITYAPDLGFVQGMVDIALFSAELVLDNIESVDDQSQAKVFWFLNTILFEFGQDLWYQSLDSASNQLADEVADILSIVYPLLGEFISNNNFSMFKYCVGSFLTMFTRLFPGNIVQRIWSIFFMTKDVNSMHASVIISILCLKFPDIYYYTSPDCMQIAQLFGSIIHINEVNDFLAIISSILTYFSPKDQREKEIDFSFSFFKPSSF